MRLSKRVWFPAAAGLVVGLVVLLWFAVPKFRYALQDALRGFGWKSADTDQIYWCPMDPEIKQEGPGMCPV